jgi:hypothetical protein
VWLFRSRLPSECGGRQRAVRSHLSSPGRSSFVRGGFRWCADPAWYSGLARVCRFHPCACCQRRSSRFWSTLRWCRLLYDGRGSGVRSHFLNSLKLKDLCNQGWEVTKPRDFCGYRYEISAERRVEAARDDVLASTQGFAGAASLGCAAPTQVPSGETGSRFASQPSKESGIIEETEHGPHAPTR